jgi:hypothetical protein
MTCRACEEARRAALEFYDRMAASIRARYQTPPKPVKPHPAKYHDRPWRAEELEPPKAGK